LYRNRYKYIHTILYRKKSYIYNKIINKQGGPQLYISFSFYDAI